MVVTPIPIGLSVTIARTLPFHVVAMMLLVVDAPSPILVVVPFVVIPMVFVVVIPAIAMLLCQRGAASDQNGRTQAKSYEDWFHCDFLDSSILIGR